VRERVYGAGIGVFCAAICLAMVRLPWGWLGVIMTAALVGWATGSHMRRLRRSAERDQLTGLNNRIPFERLLQDEYERAARYRRPLSLLFVEIDDFGRVNINGRSLTPEGLWSALCLAKLIVHGTIEVSLDISSTHPS